jgi:NAD(P)-dependent dehydrogenase (short-subunit alcohol dehydrogenase family)
VARRVIVTGAASGIGEACSVLLEAAGWSVLRWDLDTDPAVDVSDPVAVESALARLADEGEIQAVICAAGILRVAPFESSHPDLWDEVLAVNLYGVVNVLRCLCAHWTAHGTSGRAVAISSMATERGMAEGTVYGASKGALNVLVRSLAVEWGPRGWRINAVLPGSVDTKLLRSIFAERDDPEEAFSSFQGEHPFGRVATPTEIAEVCEFLVSDRSSYISGALIPVDGALNLG